MKAQMLHMGDKQGVSMLNSLKNCEKTIGEKIGHGRKKKPQEKWWVQLYLILCIIFISLAYDCHDSSNCGSFY